MNRPLRVLQVNIRDDRGQDAVRTAWALHQAYRKFGVEAWMAVGRKFSDDSNVFEIPNQGSRPRYARALLEIGCRIQLLNYRFRGMWRLGEVLKWAAEPLRHLNVIRGMEDFHYPGTWHILELCPKKPDIVHCHDLRGYFDLRALPWLSQNVPVILTLHNSWLLDAKIQQRDKIFCCSRLYVSTPSRWLMDKVERSYLADAIIESRVIPYGVDLSVFYPLDKQAAKTRLKIGTSTKVILSVTRPAQEGNGEDYQAIRAALEKLAMQIPKLEALAIVIGRPLPSERVGKIELRFLSYPKNPETAARFYQAADVYIHLGPVGIFPLAILEAFACGVPVIATATGGIPEQVEDSIDGFLVLGEDGSAVASRLGDLLTNEALCQRMARQAAGTAAVNFSLQREANDYLDWYENIYK